MSPAPRALGRLMGGAVRRPVLVAALAGLLALAGGLLAVATLHPQTSPDTLIGRSTPEYRASADYARRFGEDAVYVLVREPVTQLTLTSDLLRMISLEGCLSGTPPPPGTALRGGPAGPCAKLAALRPAKVVIGPGTFVNESVSQIQDQFSAQRAASAAQERRAAAVARKLAKAQGASAARQDTYAKAAAQAVANEFKLTTARLALRYKITALPQVNDPRFVAGLVFDPAKPPGTPKRRFAYLFPSPDAGLIQVRLRPDLTPGGRREAIGVIRAAVRMPDWRLPNGRGTYVVTGAPVVVADLTDTITSSIALLFGAALLVMGLVLATVFRTRRRLVPLVVAVAAAAITFGVLALVGRALTIATVAALPVLIGLAVDYAIQLQARIAERRRAGDELADAVAAVARAGAPTVLTAATATAAGFLVLALSPVPMVRDFAVLMVAGIAIAFGLALTLGPALLALGAPRPARALPGRRAREAIVASARGAGELVRASAAARRVRSAGRRGARGAVLLAVRRPGRVLGVAAALGVLGWGLGTQARVESDLQRLVPRDLAAVSDLRVLQEATGVGGEVDVVVASDALTQPATFRWMADYQRRVLRRAGYSAVRGCGRADLCPALALPDLFTRSTTRTEAGIDAVLDAVPSYFSQSVITPDRTVASLAFGIRLASVAEQARVIAMMRAELDPPPGVTVRLAGLPVLTAAANAKASSPWRRAELLLAGLAAVALVLLLALRSARRALVPLIPIALATGWSGLVLVVLRIDLNPMSVTLGALVVAVSTEFSVLLAERYRAERVAGHEGRDALRRTYRSTGAAVAASGLTALAGFGVLVLSDIRMLRDFGAVTVIDLAVSLAGVLVVLPAVLALDERGAFTAPLARLRRRGRRVRDPSRAAPLTAAAGASVEESPAAREPAPA